jgi:hypothetical protein
VGHDHHFLERLDRVERDHLEYALGLYRDHEGLRYVLSHVKVAGDRVALAIGSVERGPYVIVATNGHFVTCLGEGMTTGRLHVVPRDTLDALRDRYRDQRSREQIADDLRREGERDREFFTRIFDRANAVCRDELIALSAFAPLLATKFYAAAAIVSADLLGDMTTLHKVTKIKPAELPFARSVHRSYWFAAHAILLCTMGERTALVPEIARLQKSGLTLTGGITMLGSVTHLFRSAWAAAQIGEPLLGAYEAHLAAGTHAHLVIDDVACLGAIAIRHEKLRAEVLRILHGAAERAGKEKANEPIRILVELMISFIENPDQGATQALDYGRFVYTVLCKGLPEGDLHRFETPEEVPEELGRTALLGLDGDLANEAEFMLMAIMAIPVVARAKAEDFYFEREVARKVCPEWGPEATLEIVKRHEKAGHLSGVTVKAEVKPGRNEPCPCGSGKKYKKCHGG